MKYRYQNFLVPLLVLLVGATFYTFRAHAYGGIACGIYANQPDSATLDVTFGGLVGGDSVGRGIWTMYELYGPPGSTVTYTSDCPSVGAYYNVGEDAQASGTCHYTFTNTSPATTQFKVYGVSPNGSCSGQSGVYTVYVAGPGDPPPPPPPSNQPPTPTPPPPPPSNNVGAWIYCLNATTGSYQQNPCVVNSGDTVTIGASTKYSAGCSFNTNGVGGWPASPPPSNGSGGGVLPPQKTYAGIGPITQNSTFTMTCNGTGGPAKASVQVVIAATTQMSCKDPSANDNIVTSSGGSDNPGAGPCTVPTNGSTTLSWTSSGATACYVPGAEVLSYLKLDESSGTTAADSSQGGAYPGTILGTTIPVVTGKFGNGRDVSVKTGANWDSAIRIGSTDMPQLDGASLWTISMWAKAGTANSTQYFIYRDDGSKTWITSRFTGTGALQFSLGGDGNTRAVSPADTIPYDGLWHHIAIVYDGTQKDSLNKIGHPTTMTAMNDRMFKVYSDGVPQTLSWTYLSTCSQYGTNGTTGPCAVPATMPDVSAPLYIGNTSTLNRAFEGSVDDIRVYQRALDSGEVLAEAAASGTPLPLPAPQTISGATVAPQIGPNAWKGFQATTQSDPPGVTSGTIPANTVYAYWLQCTGIGGTGPAQYALVQAKDAPTITLSGSPVPGPATYGGTNNGKLTWTTSTSVASCVASNTDASNSQWDPSTSVTLGSNKTKTLTGLTLTSTYTATCNDDMNRVASASAVINVGTPAPTPTPTPNCVVAPASQLTNTNVTATGSSGIAPYSWTGGGTPSTGNGTNFTTQYSSSGVKTITVKDSINQTRGCTVTITAPTPTPTPSGTPTPTPTPRLPFWREILPH